MAGSLELVSGKQAGVIFVGMTRCFEEDLCSDESHAVVCGS
jgi:hypothetical protein